ncbi:hypothetical protein EJB05_02303, partial [Eragrostis curvula]
MGRGASGTRGTSGERGDAGRSTERVVIRVMADNIDDAAEEVIGFLKGVDTGSVIYFDGYFGWGASTILKAVVKRLKESPSLSGEAATRMGFGWDKIIHIDCSLWKSRRVLQKMIADELKLPQQVMAIFDKHDEEDDFEGVEQGSRDVISDVKWEILKALNNQKFMVVFHNGSGSYIDLWEYGVPVIKSVSGSVLWASGGRFPSPVMIRDDDAIMKSVGLSDVALSVFLPSKDDEEVQHTFKSLLYADAKEVARYIGLPNPVMSRMIVLECILYRALRGDDCSIDWGTHASNYWVCDGIIEATINGWRNAWEIANSLQMNMNIDLSESEIELIRDCGEQWVHSDRWVSANDLKGAAIQVPPEATSFFCSANISSRNNNATLVLEADKDAVDYRGVEKRHSNNSRNNGACFRKLWVLDLRHTNWYWLLSEDMMDEMVELRELNRRLAPMSCLSHSSHLVSPCSANTKVKSISFQGCARLESLLLTGLFQSLLELDISGTALKTLNLSAMQAPHLRRLFLLACGNLCAILWPQEEIELDVVRIDTTTTILAGEDKDTKEASHVKNVRFLDSLNVEISSDGFTVAGGHKVVSQEINSSAGSSEQQVQAQNLYTDDIVATVNDISSSQAVGAYRGVGDVPTKWMWTCPILSCQDLANCYIIIQDEKHSKVPQ